jgi:hypothetical protein
MPLTCPYCKNAANLVNGAEVYPRRPDLAHKLFWKCAPCGAYVGCHQGGSDPLGRLANPELRRWKQAAHRWFDPIWKSRTMTRRAAYSWLAKELGIPAKDTHIGMFDVETCRRVVEVCMERQKGEVA